MLQSKNVCLEAHWCMVTLSRLDMAFLSLHSLTFKLPPQLLHTLTKKYVRVNTTLTSRTENTSLRVELCTENSSGCIFKILPRYKVRSVGDVVSPFIGCSSSSSIRLHLYAPAGTL